MMYTIAIKEGKATRTSWSTEKLAYITDPIESLIPYLNCPLSLEKTTFKQFFSFISRDLELYNTIFRSSTYGIPLKPFESELHEPLDPGPREWSPRGTEKPKLDIDYLEIIWGADIEEGVLVDYPGFHGWGDWDDGSGIKGGIALEFTPVNLYKDHELRLNDEYEITGEDLKSVYKGRKGFRTYEVIRAILFEITWAGDISDGRETPF